MKLLSSVLPAQESYACDVEGVDADFLLLMAGHRTDNPTVAIEHFLTYLSVSYFVSWVVSFVISLKFIPWGCLQCSWLVISRKTD